MYDDFERQIAYFRFQEWPLISNREVRTIYYLFDVECEW